MNILLFVIFFIANLTTVGVAMFCYGDRYKYVRGMIMGVHIPPEMANHEEVQRICQDNKKLWDRFHRVNLVLSVVICALIFISFEWFMVIWCIWLAGYIIYLNYLVIVPHRKIYQLKIENNWIDEKTKHLVYVDLKTSAQTSKMAYNWKIHLLIVAAILISGIPLLLQKNQSMINLNGWVVYFLCLSVSGVFIWLHIMMVHRKNEVYSENQEINLAINQLWKHSLSVGLLIGDIINGISWGYLAIQIARNDWIYGKDFTIYIILQMIAACVILVPLIQTRTKKRELLEQDTAPVYVDDDEYWKKGWYNNPNDKRIMIQDRMCPTNYTFNMGNPIAKVLNAGLMIILFVTLLGTGVLMISLSNSSTEISVDDTQVKIKASIYKCEFNISEMESVELLEQMPQENFFKTNGAATDDYSIGYFSGNKSGACMLFLYGDEIPILKITLSDKTVFVNSEEKDAVEKWYEKLTE